MEKVLVSNKIPSDKKTINTSAIINTKLLNMLPKNKRLCKKL